MYIPGHYAFVLFAILLAQSSVLFIYTVIGLLKSSPVPLFGPAFPPPPPGYLLDGFGVTIDRGLPVQHGGSTHDLPQVTVTVTDTTTVSVTASVDWETICSSRSLGSLATSPAAAVVTSVENNTAKLPQVTATPSSPSQITSTPLPENTPLTSPNPGSTTSTTLTPTATSPAPSSTTPATITQCTRLLYQVEKLSTGYVTNTVPTVEACSSA